MAGLKDSDDQNDSGNDTGKYDTDDAARDTGVPEKEEYPEWVRRYEDWKLYGKSK